MKETIEKIIKEKINPALALHGGSCAFVGIRDETVVQVKLQGACGGCPGALITLKGFVLDTLQAEEPRVTDVEAV